MSKTLYSDSSGNSDNGGGIDNDLYTGSFYQWQTSFSPLATKAGLVISESPDNAGYIRLTGTAADFSSCRVGIITNVVFSSEVDYTSGRYAMIDIDTSDYAWIDVKCTYINTTPTATAYVGGSLDTVYNLTGFSSAGDTLRPIGNSTLTSNWTISSGSSYSEQIRIIATKSDGTSITPSRGSDGKLDTTDMVAINCGSDYQVFVGSNVYLQSVRIYGSKNDYICEPGGNDKIQCYGCQFHATGSGTSRSPFNGDDDMTCIDCDFLWDNTAVATAIHADGRATFIGCLFQTASTAAGYLVDSMAGQSYSNCIFSAPVGSLVKGFYGGYGSIGWLTVFKNCNFYNIKTIFEYYYTADATLHFINNIVHTATDLFSNESTGDLVVHYINNCEYNVTNSPEDESGLIVNVQNTLSDDPDWTDPATGDFRLSPTSPCYDFDTGELIGALGPDEPSGGGGGVRATRPRMLGIS